MWQQNKKKSKKSKRARNKVSKHLFHYNSYSCVGVWESERVEIVANEQGNRTTPSYVAFSETERLVGDAAKNQAAMNPKNTVFDAKRLIGRRFDDAEVKADSVNWPFTLIDDGIGNPKVQVESEGETKSFTPQGKIIIFFFFFFSIFIFFCFGATKIFFSTCWLAWSSSPLALFSERSLFFFVMNYFFWGAKRKKRIMEKKVKRW